MPHAVVQQVFEKASEQGTVDRNLCVFGGSCLIQRNFAVFCQGTVVELSDQFTEQRSGGKSFFSEWLRTIFQFAGQIQVVNKRAEFFTLSTNSCSFVPYCIGQGRILFQLFSPSKDQSQWCAYIMADTCDPLRSRIIPPHEHFISFL